MKNLFYVLLVLTALSSGCSKGTKQDTPTPTPSETTVAITDFAPKAAMVAEVVEINGAGFGTNINNVIIRFKSANPVSPVTLTDTKITVKVPSDAQSGMIDVTVNGKTVATSSAFTLTTTPAPIVTITDFTPKIFAEGDTVIITGTNFGSNINAVTLNLHTGTNIRPYAVSPTKISVVIPYDANVGWNLEGNLRLNVEGFQPALSSAKFTYQMRISANSIDYSSARPGEIVNINVKVNRIDFGKAVADLNPLSFTFGSSGAVKALALGDNGLVAVRVPSDATSGKVKIAYTGYSGSTSSFNFSKLALLPKPQSGKWTQGAEYKSTGKVGSVAFVIGSKAYVGLGYTGAPLDNFGSSDIWEFDSQYDSWMQRADYGGGLRVYSVAFSVSEKGYVGTGYDHTYKQTNDFWEYNPATNKWKRIADFKGSARVYANAFAIGNLGYVGAGTSETTAFNDYYSYSPTANSWTQISSIPEKRVAPYSFVISGNAYVGNGRQGVSDLYMYDPTANSWTAKAGIPDYASNSGVGFSIGGKGYAGLGQTQSSTDKFFEYSPSTDRWTSIAPFGGGRRIEAVAFAIGNVAYVGMGGTFNNSLAQKDFWRFTP